MKSIELIESLINQNSEIIFRIEKFRDLDLKSLTWRKDETSWNILECIEHLNLYGVYYLPHIESAIKNSASHFEAEFNNGILGNYFAKTMLPKEKLNKMKTFKDKNPINKNLDKSVIDIFLNQQKKLLELLNQSKKVSLNKVRIPISIAKLIKLKLGDTFLFYTNHIMRHVQQMERIQSSITINLE
jgi:hypothetical protein